MKVNAYNMKELANKDSEELNNILDMIKKEAVKGKLSLYLDNTSLEDSTRRNLDSRGFRVETGGRYNEINTVISWA